MSQILTQNNGNTEPFAGDTNSLLTEIKHLKEILSKKDIEIRQKNEIISFYRSRTLKDNQNFCLIVMLFAEIQRLKNKIQTIESQGHAKWSNFTNENLKKQLKKIAESSDLPNFNLLKELQECFGKLCSCYKFGQDKDMRSKQFSNTPISSTETYQSSTFIDQSRQQKILSSTSLAESIFLNSEISKDSQDQEEPSLYTPIKNHQCRLLTFGKISQQKSLDLSTDLLTSQGSFSLESQSVSFQFLKTPKNSQDNGLSFLSHRRKIPLATLPEHKAK